MPYREMPIRRLRATLCEVEHGLFSVSYASESGDAKTLPIYQVGADVTQAQQRVEERALASGFDTVVWDETPMHALLQDTPP